MTKPEFKHRLYLSPDIIFSIFAVISLKASLSVSTVIPGFNGSSYDTVNQVNNEFGMYFFYGISRRTLAAPRQPRYPYSHT